MRKEAKLLLLGLMNVAFLLVGCSSDENTEPIDNPGKFVNITLEPEGMEAVGKANEFAFDLLSSIMDSKVENQNICFSPFSAFNTLALAANGASEETCPEILRLFNLGENPQSDILTLNKTCKELISKLPIVDNRVLVNMTNSFWFAPGLEADNDFSKVLMDWYYGTPVNMDPSGEAGMNQINQWVKANTNGMIDRFLEEPMENTFGLLNTVYFKGEWSEQFSRRDTYRGEFMNEDGTKSKTEFMRGDISLREAETEDFRMVSLSFGSGNFWMSFVMTGELQYSQMRDEAFTSDMWNDLKSRQIKSERQVSIPKFDFEHGVNLYETLDKTHPGLLKRVNFDRLLATGTNIEVNKLIQKTKITVNEEGAEASSTTWGGGETSPGPIVFNRPFYFLIHEESTGAILFLGKINAF